MRWSVAAVGLLGLVVRDARAEEDPRDTFGFTKKKQPPQSCDDGLQFGCAVATDVHAETSPHALRTWLPSTYLLRLPVGDARHDQVAHLAVGAGRDEAGPYFAGATGLENRWTIEGAPADGVRTGNFDTRVPLTFMEGMLVIAGGFAARDRASTGGTIDVRLRRGGDHHELEAHAWSEYVSDPRARPIPTGSYQLRRLAVTRGPSLSMSVVGTGPLGKLRGGQVWYAAGVAPAIGYTDFAWTTGRLVDDDGDGRPDHAPGPIVTAPVVDEPTARTLDFFVPIMARTGWKRGRDEIELTLIGNITRDTSHLALSTVQAGGIDRLSYVADGIVTWRRKWQNTRLRAQLAWHRSERFESARDPDAADIPQRLTAFIPTMLAEEPALAEACNDLNPDDPVPTVANCPVPSFFFASGGAGLLIDSTGDRPTTTVDISHRRGRHVVRAGGTLEDTRLVTWSRFTGYEVERSLFEGHSDRQRFFEDDCPEFDAGDPEQPCRYITGSELYYRTRYTAAYVEDTFELAPNLRVDGGLRWELMWVGPSLHLSDQFAPRLGVAWDRNVLDVGRLRAWASMGRSFVMLPAGLGPTVIERSQTVRDVSLDLGTGPVKLRSTDLGGAYRVAPGIEPAAQDEITAGLELGMPKLLRVTVWAQGRWLRRGYETVLANTDTFEAKFDNPGRNGETPARRDALVVAAELMMQPSDRSTVRASYLYGVTTGSWTGPFDPRQGGVLYAGTEWDLESRNLHGRLPTDPGHRVFVEGERRGKLSGIEIAVATRLTAGSGRPRNILVDSDSLGIIHVLPRGSAGRGPLISQANVRLAARWRGTDFTLELFNVFDRTAATNLDEVYAVGDFQPIVGGSSEDLVFLKDEIADAQVASAPARRSGYRLPTAFQSPFGATLGVHRRF